MKPFKFKPNRVWRVYLGGKLLDELRQADNPKDGLFPEDWIASAVEANNPQHGVEGEGISTALINDREIPFDQLLATCGEELLGPKHLAAFGASLGILTKFLDSAIRLPVQAHPDPETAERLYNSKYGKTETWIVLGTRKINDEEPYLIVGFNEDLDESVFRSEGIAGEIKRGLTMVHKHQVKPGDVLLIKGGMVHAIGPGIFLVEIMEPTDLVVQPERYCGDQELTDSDMFGKVSPEAAMDVFHYQPMSKTEAWDSCELKPTVIEENDQGCYSQLIDRKQIRFFGATKLDLHGEWLLDPSGTCQVGMVCSGKLTMIVGDELLSLMAGDTFFVPFSSPSCRLEGKAELIFALPPAVS